MEEQKKRYMEELREKIWYHAKKYHVDCSPEISDYEYDKLFAELTLLEKENPQWITPDSPTQRVAPFPLSKFEKYPHKIPMISIDNSYSIEEIKEFDARLHRLLKSQEPLTYEEEPISYVVEPKIDGVAISLWYENGILVRALTRGDGKIGELVTQNVRTITKIPLKLLSKKPPKCLEIRGEVYLPHREFQKINEEREAQSLPLFANPRNAAAGTLKLLDPKLVAQRKLQFFAHSLGYSEGISFESHSQAMQLFSQWGIPTTPYSKKVSGIEEVIKICQTWETQPPKLPYDTDGMVIKVDEIRLREQLGSTAHSPRWVIAYKFSPAQARVKLKEVIVQVGKGGTLTPVGILEPVFLAGTKVSRASLHNYLDIARKDVRVGDMVTIVKAGEIIPYVLCSHPEMRNGQEIPILPPETCPVCGSQVKKDESGVYFRCSNFHCRGGFKSRLKFFASRSGMNIKGLGDKIIEQLVDKGLVHGFADLYRLTLESFAYLERMGKKSSQKILSAIQASKSREPHRLLCALGIRHVGEQVAHVLMERFQSLIKLANATSEEIQSVPRIGPVIAKTVSDFFHSEYGRRTLMELRDVGLCMEYTTKPKEVQSTTHGKENEQGETSQFWKGKNVVITGTLEKFTRQELKEILQKKGAKVSSDVSKKTDVLIVGEKPGSKLKRAQEFKIPIMDQPKLMEILL